MHSSPSSTLTRQLHDAFQFTDYDLAHNRSGRLSPDQTERLIRQTHKLGLRVGALLCMTGVVFIVLTLINEQGKQPPFLVILIILILIIALMARIKYLSDEIRQGHVLRFSGRVQRKTVRSDDGDYYVLILEDRRFNVTAHAYELIEAERQYTVYCTRRLEVVSIEPL